jgi:hypothetical protein
MGHNILLIYIESTCATCIANNIRKEITSYEILITLSADGVNVLYNNNYYCSVIELPLTCFISSTR